MEPLTFKNLRSSIFGTFNFIFFEFPLTNLNRGWENPYQVYSERYRNEDAHLLEEVINNMDIDRQFTMEEVDQRLKDGHIFYVAKKSGEIIGYCWYLVNKVNIQEFYATQYLKLDEVCSVNSYIRPEFRGKGIKNYMRAFEYNELEKKGYKRVSSFVFENNKASMRTHQKWGSVQIGIVKLINILTLTYRYTNLPPDTIEFHGDPFILWKRLFHRKKNINRSGVQGSLGSGFTKN